MKRSTIFFLLVGCLLSAEAARAQSALIRQGDKLYEQMAYIRALSLYEKAYRKDSVDQTLKLKIAESYRHLNDPENAERWYSQVVDDSVATSEHQLYYAEALSSNGKYQQAQRWFERYAREKGQERRIQNRLQGAQQSEVFYRNQSYITISEAPFNSPQSDFAPTFYDSGLVFTSARQGRGRFAWDDSNYLDLYQLEGEDAIEPFSKVINSRYHEGASAFYDNGTKVIFTRSDYQDNKLGNSQDGVNKLKLFYSELQDNGKWSEPTLLSFNSSEYSCGHPTLDSRGTLYFASDMPGGFGGTDLYRSEYANGQWQAPVNLGETVNTEGDEMFPFLWEDRELYFASNGHRGLGGLDVFGLDISQGTGGYITNLGYPINTSTDDFSLIVEPGDQRNGQKMPSGMPSGYFASNRSGGAGSDDIYHFTSLKPLLDRPTVSGTVADEGNNQPVAGATVILQNDEGKKVATTTTDEQGHYSFPVTFDAQYKAIAQREDYLENQATFSTTDKQKVNWEANITLRKNHDFSLFGLILESNDNTPISGVRVRLTDNMTGEPVLNVTTDTKGSFSYTMAEKELNDRISYQIQLSREGYLSKTLTYNAQLTQPGQINLHEILNVRLDKIDIGTDIGALVDLKPIYFDLGKYVIRPDAAQELNKIVAIMNENPGLEIELGSHTDARGSATSNLRLSDQRARASADYIVSQGIDRTRIVGKGYGESTLINRCADGVTCSEAEHQLNRRTEFKVTSF